MKWKKNKKCGWYVSSRRYLHFDEPINYEHAKTIVTSTHAVQTHAFFPFLHIELKTKKTKANEDGTISRIPKTRPIMYASHIDSHIYSYYASIISDLYEDRLNKHIISDCILAFRKLQHRCNIHFAHDAFNTIMHLSPCTAYAFDVTKFFDTINHEQLKTEWCNVLGESRLPGDHYAVFKSLTKYCYANRDEIYKRLGISKQKAKRDRRKICKINEFRDIIRKGKYLKCNANSFGIPQGSPLSGLLSNIYLFKFDINMHELAKNNDGYYRRYCDDILLVFPSHSSTTEELVKKVVTDNLKAINLNINDDKTIISHFNTYHSRITATKPLQYLGFTFDGENISIRSSSYIRYIKKMRSRVRLDKKTQSKRNMKRQSRGLEEKALYKKSLYSLYSYRGHRNFISYGLRAAKIMDSSSIKKQLKPLWKKLQQEIKA